MAELESIKKLKNWAKNFKSEVYTLALKMIPEPVLEEARKKAIDFRPGKPKSWGAAIIIIAVWVCLPVMVTVLVIQQ
ncbi:hypothetical protein Desca_0328 [Desulfotomaculum nigrificans CO-1-SRB]|uniref:Uncharacterized protein n=1 Tax=Desulfotomaculum nigrificans (strain DSM 14880 / VKM B-2319 / CO-1-SRB) TaxID=868595 RepID=F6B6F3_DESCC|nr:hypothetical protein [Desulfotomaculum nigrificans]AEF93224.1 hypothetical protein Desca_0328 [Desulfotomaculum nigrificans CO-1-SRB]